MKLTKEQRAELKALAEDPFSTFGSRTIRALLADLEKAEYDQEYLCERISDTINVLRDEIIGENNEQ